MAFGRYWGITCHRIEGVFVTPVEHFGLTTQDLARVDSHVYTAFLREVHGAPINGIMH